MKKLKVKKHDDISVITIPDTLHQNDYLELKGYLSKTLLVNGDINILMDCESVKELPSLAFGVFCSIARDITRAGGNFGLIHVSSEIKNTLNKIHTDQQIRSFRTVNDAKQHFDE